jgi:predicted DCC family thiol-disulfide oxidoreductase YuxK
MQKHFKHVPQIVAWQQADLPKMGLTAEQCQTAVQWVSEDMLRTLSAHKAVARVCKDAGGIIAVAGYAMSLPVISPIAGVVYRWVARNRQKMPGGTEACAIDFEKKI